MNYFQKHRHFKSNTNFQHTPLRIQSDKFPPKYIKMCLETLSHHYCGHSTSKKGVCQGAHVDQRRSFISKLFICQTQTKCQNSRVEQNVFTPCQRCFQDIPLREFISRIPQSFPTQQQLAMIATWESSTPCTPKSTKRQSPD